MAEREMPHQGRPCQMKLICMLVQAKIVCQDIEEHALVTLASASPQSRRSLKHRVVAGHVNTSRRDTVSDNANSCTPIKTTASPLRVHVVTVYEVAAEQIEQIPHRDTDLKHIAPHPGAPIQHSNNYRSRSKQGSNAAIFPSALFLPYVFHPPLFHLMILL